MIQSYSCRIDRGELMLLTMNVFRLLKSPSNTTHQNRHHFSKEYVAQFYTAHIVPKGSPLLVIIRFPVRSFDLLTK